jgi:hypothetical protein
MRLSPDDPWERAVSYPWLPDSVEEQDEVLKWIPEKYFSTQWIPFLVMIKTGIT